MPLYEYKCVKCGERVEIIQRVADPPYAHCPKCSGDMQKQISSPAIQFKGSGFYKTDYATKKSSSDGSTAGKSTETKSDTKSDTKSETKSDSGSSGTGSSGNSAE